MHLLTMAFLVCSLFLPNARILSYGPDGLLQLAPMTPGELYEKYNTILTGTILDAHYVPSLGIQSYDVKVSQFVKPQKQASVITVFANDNKTGSEQFMPGDNVQLYLDQEPGRWVVMPYSFKMDKRCDYGFSGLSILNYSAPAPAYDPIRFLDLNGHALVGNPPLGKQLQMRYSDVNDTPLNKTHVEITVYRDNDIMPVFHDAQEVPVVPCHGIVNMSWNLTPEKTGNYTIVLNSFHGIYDNKILFRNFGKWGETFAVGTGTSPSTAFSSPLKQVQSVTTDKSHYRWGDKMTITGRVNGSGMLQLRILNPFQSPVVSKYFFPKPDGTFSQIILATGPLWSVTGNYAVEINGLGANKTRTELYFDSNRSSSRLDVVDVHASPLNQLKSGVAVENVKCNKGLILAIRVENKSPACVTPQNAQILGQRGWAEQAGTDIVLQKPSATARQFPICNSNPAKEKLVREKQQLLSGALLPSEKKHGGFANQTSNLPWSQVGYDCVGNALEVGILPQYFTADLLPKYFQLIRSIVGYSIDVALFPQGYTQPD